METPGSEDAYLFCPLLCPLQPEQGLGCMASSVVTAGPETERLMRGTCHDASTHCSMTGGAPEPLLAHGYRQHLLGKVAVGNVFGAR